MTQMELTLMTATICMVIPFAFFLAACKLTKRRPYACPACDHDVPISAPNCPNCGAPMPDQDVAI